MCWTAGAPPEKHGEMSGIVLKHWAMSEKCSGVHVAIPANYFKQWDLVELFVICSPPSAGCGIGSKRANMTSATRAAGTRGTDLKEMGSHSSE